jgi:hypothetical protein
VTYPVAVRVVSTAPALDSLDFHPPAVVESATTNTSKIGKVSFASLGPIELVDCIITDEGISDSDRLALELKGVKVIIA